MNWTLFLLTLILSSPVLSQEGKSSGLGGLLSTAVGGGSSQAKEPEGTTDQNPTEEPYSNGGPMVSPSSCPYLVRDTDSAAILQNLGPRLQSEMQALQARMTREQANCQLPAANDVALTGQLIQIMARDLAPPSSSFESIKLAGQQISCTTTAQGFYDVLKSYKSFAIESFRDFPDDVRELNRYLDMDQADGERINQVFRACHGTVAESASKTLTALSACVDTGLFGQGQEDRNALAYQVWNTNCGQNLTERSQELQRLLNTAEGQTQNTKRVEELLTQAYSQIGATVDSLLAVDPSCPVASQAGNIASTLITSGMRVGQNLGSPWVGLALNLAVKPVQVLIRRLTQQSPRQQERELTSMLSFINGDERSRNETLMCSLFSMQKLQCETMSQYERRGTAGADCPPEGTTTQVLTGLEDTLKQIRSLQENSLPSAAPAETTPSALDVLVQSSEDMSRMHDLFFKPVPELRPIDGGPEQSLYDYLFSPTGVVSQNFTSLSTSDGIRMGAEKARLGELQQRLDGFRSTLTAVQRGTNAETAAAALASFRNLSEVLTDSRGPAQGIPFVLEKYYDQVLRSGNSNLHNYASRARNALAGSLARRATEAGAGGLAVADRFQNTRTFYAFLSGEYSQQNLLGPVVRKIGSLPGVSTGSGQRAIDFDTTVLPAMRDCMFLYQPVMMTKFNESRRSRGNGLIGDYQSKCAFMFNCQEDLTIKLDPDPSQDLNSSTSIEAFRPVCNVQQNFSFIFSKARANYLRRGNVCPR